MLNNRGNETLGNESASQSDSKSLCAMETYVRYFGY